METGPSAVALIRADSKQENEMFANCFELGIVGTELNREIQLVWGEREPNVAVVYVVIATLLLLLLLLLLYLLSHLCTLFTIMCLKQNVIIFNTVLQLLCIYCLRYM